MDKVKSNTNFWIEISKNNIQVPCYQRDYAQGRKDGSRIDNIRKVFVEELFHALETGTPCHLGLVFGSYDEVNNVFIAVDGQQRLTTVFLLHWFVAWKEGKLNKYREILKKFSWDTRSYSSQFVDLLFEISTNRCSKIVDAIKSNINYFSIWENDPTVKGMLTMLDEIDSQYPDNNSAMYLKLFSDDCRIIFDILKLEKDSDGKTYLKMNSRGRSLTTFELFKSKFIDTYKPKFEDKFDKEWLTFMLARSIGQNNQFSDPDFAYMNFINEYAYLKYAEGCFSPEESHIFINAKMKGDLIDVPFVSFEWHKKAFDNNLDSFEKSFDWITSNYDSIKSIDDNLRFNDSRFFLDAIIKDNNPNYTHRTKFFATIRFAQLIGYNPIDESLYKKWARVIRNLVTNSNIEAGNFSRICETINEINNCDIYKFFSNGGLLDAFDKDQIAEEIAKAKRINEAPSWDDVIIEAEKFAFFKGAIRFLFTKENIGDDWEHFDTKWGNAQKYFDDNGVKDGNSPNQLYKTNSLLMKSLLANGDWSNIWWHFEFSNDNVRWKRILTSGKWKNAVDVIMSTDITTEITQNYVNNTKDVNILHIIDDGLMDYICNKMSGARIRGTYSNNRCYRYDYHAIWQSGYPAFQVVINPILSRLQFDGKVKYSNFDGRDSTIPNCRYYKCINRNVDFKYETKGKCYYFQWYGAPSVKELDIYLLDENWEYKTRPNHEQDKIDKDNYYCFGITEEMQSDPSLFTKELDCLIAQAYQGADKSVCEKCKDKICEESLEQ